MYHTHGARTVYYPARNSGRGEKIFMIKRYEKILPDQRTEHFPLDVYPTALSCLVPPVCLDQPVSGVTHSRLTMYQIYSKIFS